MLPLILALVAAPQQQSTGGAILIDRDRVDRTAAPHPAQTEGRRPGHRIHVASGGADVPIRGIRFIGAKAPEPVARAAQRFLGKAATKPNLFRLAAALSAAYAKSPVALYTVAVPEQDFAGGVVTISLTEGRIAKAQLKGTAPGSHPLLRARMARMMGEAPLSRATFERQVTLMRSIPGLTFDADFADPAADGALVMTVTPKQKRSKLSFGFSNRGVDLLGDGEWDASGEFYGVATDGDLLSLNASAASDLKRYRYAGGSYAAPLTADGLTLTASAAYLETRPRGYSFTGHATQAGLSLSYPLVRSFHRSADVTLGVDGLNSDNALFGNQIANQDTRAARLAIGYTDTRTKRTVSASVSVSRGLGALGARVVAPYSQPDFTKLTAVATAGQQIGKRTFVRVNASAQYSRDRLPATELFSLGGASIGRAFDTGILTGDRGAGGSAELAWRPLAKGRLATSEFYTFVDGGVVAVVPRGTVARQDYSLASAGVGVRARYAEKAELGLEAARALDDPYSGYDENWRVSVEWRVTM